MAKYIKKPKLWLRILSCGHERTTNVHYIVGEYGKPKVGDQCFCRDCNDYVTIIEVVAVK